MEAQKNQWDSKAEMTVQEICSVLHSNWKKLITEGTENMIELSLAIKSYISSFLVSPDQISLSM